MGVSKKGGFHPGFQHHPRRAADCGDLASVLDMTECTCVSGGGLCSRRWCELPCLSQPLVALRRLLPQETSGVATAGFQVGLALNMRLQ